MLLTLTSTTAPARDLGFLLHKHPDRVQSFTLGFGAAHLFYPEANEQRCTAALLLDVDPVSLVRGRPASTDDGGMVDAYVNDRPYVASSFMSVAIARVLGTALAGRSEAAPDPAERALELEACVTPVRCEGDLSRRLFAPLGYAVHAEPVVVPDAAHAGRHERVTLAATTTLQRLLAHLYVLIPVLDDEKHYWVGEAEAEKLIRYGGDWLVAHPERDLIVRRYLRRAPAMARATVTRLAALTEGAPLSPEHADERATGERTMRMQERRIATTLDVLRAAEARSVVDLGCGNGDLVAALAREPQIERVLGVDVSPRELEHARARIDRLPLPASRRERIAFAQSSLVYADARVRGFDAAALLEVIEHVDTARLPALERAVFGAAHPRTVVVTTPNAEYNALFPRLEGRFRHPDHRFEWSRAAFAAWASATAEAFGYAVDMRPVGEVDATYGPATQMAVFRWN